MSVSKHLKGARTWESVAICLCVWVCDMWVGAGCSWVVQLWAEWLSEMTVINSFILEPVDYTINHLYWWRAWRTYLWVSAVHVQQGDTSYTGTVNRRANVCQLVMYLATERPIPHRDIHYPPGATAFQSGLTLGSQVGVWSQHSLFCPMPTAEKRLLPLEDSFCLCLYHITWKCDALKATTMGFV